MSICAGGTIGDELFVLGEETRLMLTVISKPFAGPMSLASLCTFLNVSGSIQRCDYSMHTSDDNGL